MISDDFSSLIDLCQVAKKLEIIPDTVFAQIETRASIYLESTLDPASIRDRLLFETGLYRFKQRVDLRMLRETTYQSAMYM